MKKLLDNAQYTLLIGSLLMVMFVSWKVGVVVLAIDFVIGVARQHWSKS